ncbi:DUF4279 domain-containing protein [Paraburkholderia sp. MMS20-SJTR3]|uniref:DUF4279 domain-containing protein n=1 Tax=Paraburkholderia sejongensis TaxID=2886946 RepID=A0ABS8K256_9BURK|nr:DUF4279 domain-containing protein [Paraburkholderia sp. MMS20-SJTR3]MCC8396239.1 DUF4279 domain-containing protein [Paraburkholderia sp. MMS20-SJTR3]
MTDTHRLAHVSFTVTGESLRPEFWSAYFGVVPDFSAVKGERFTTPSGQLSSVPGRTGVWAVRSEIVIRSDTLEPHLRYLLARLRLPRSDLRQVLADNGARMRFLCYWDNESGDRVPDVPADIRVMVAAMGGTVEIDEYR